MMRKIRLHARIPTAWKVPKYGVFSGLHFLVFSPNTEIFSCIQSEYRKKRTRKKLCIWTLFTQCPQNISWYDMKHDIFTIEVKLNIRRKREGFRVIKMKNSKLEDVSSFGTKKSFMSAIFFFVLCHLYHKFFPTWVMFFYPIFKFLRIYYYTNLEVFKTHFSSLIVEFFLHKWYMEQLCTSSCFSEVFSYNAYSSKFKSQLTFEK